MLVSVLGFSKLPNELSWVFSVNQLLTEIRSASILFAVFVHSSVELVPIPMSFFFP